MGERKKKRSAEEIRAGVADSLGIRRLLEFNSRKVDTTWRDRKIQSVTGNVKFSYQQIQDKNKGPHPSYRQILGSEIGFLKGVESISRC